MTGNILLIGGEHMAGMVDYKEVVAQLEAEIKPKVDLITALNDLSRIYPDLQVYVPPGMPSTYMVASQSANVAVSGYDMFEYPMGKDEKGADLVDVCVWPFATINGMKVYSVPMAYKIGTINTRGWGISAASGWDDHMYNDHIPFGTIRDLRNYLAGKPAINYLD